MSTDPSVINGVPQSVIGTFEQRKHKRFAFSSRVEISWVDARHVQHSAAGTGVNFSIYGMLVRVSVPVPTRTEITIRVDDVEVSRKASVRHCCQVQSWFQIGLKFDGTLWQPWMQFN